MPVLPDREPQPFQLPEGVELVRRVGKVKPGRKDKYQGLRIETVSPYAWPGIIKRAETVARRMTQFPTCINYGSYDKDPKNPKKGKVYYALRARL